MSGSDGPEFKKLGMVGAGSMGGMMSMLYAEHGVDVHFFDPSEENVNKLLEQAKDLKTSHKVVHEPDYEQLCKNIETPDEPRLFVFSIPHGSTGDKTVDGLLPHLKKGDIILDCSNEYWENTERRQTKLDPHGIHYVGCGVSGGYQSARHGPSMSPGGSAEALEKIMPFLRRVAAKDHEGRPCTTAIGPGGSGHYVKMIHNGIEQGMMSALAEVWHLMTTSLGMRYDEVAAVFDGWNTAGPLRDNFLVAIGAHINRTRDGQGNYVLADVRDKVVQDANEEEGTGIWSCEQSIRLHVPAPTIVGAHLFRLGSSDAASRAAVAKAFSSSSSDKDSPSMTTRTPQPITHPTSQARSAFIHDLHAALHAAFLAAFIQGLHVLATAAHRHGWPLDYAAILAIWRGGCIIQSDALVDVLISAFREHLPSAGSSPPTALSSILTHPALATALTTAYPALKRVVLAATATDAYVPSLSATLEWVKYSSGTELPTQFMEAQLDYFGEHMFESKARDEVGRGVEKGGRHWEWKPAKGIFDE